MGAIKQSSQRYCPTSLSMSSFTTRKRGASTERRVAKERRSAAGEILGASVRGLRPTPNSTPRFRRLATDGDRKFLHPTRCQEKAKDRGQLPIETVLPVL